DPESRHLKICTGDGVYCVRRSSATHRWSRRAPNTLYAFARDTTNTSTCYGRCASIWPPLLTTGATASPGVNSSHLVADTLEHLPDQLTASRSIYVKEATRHLEQAGWDKQVTDTHTRLTPAGEHAELAGLSLQRHPEPWQGEEFEQFAETITMWGGPKGSARWEAKFTRDTPLHLVAAATRSLVTPSPVERYRDDLDLAVLPYLASPDRSRSTRAAAARATSTTTAAGHGAAVVVAPPAAAQRDAAAVAKKR
ncbi:DUF317 domain-containing protein, partial [Kitasatospora sp. NPDC058190]|uniref:DUF317 domain-containing protein n=1 Tax=Kitasatospora sp. NPDC058190 TaxID=3346371 RepID=UPI0036D77B38